MAFFAFVQVTGIITFLLLNEFGNESVPLSQRDQGHPSLCGSSLSLTSCLMAHQEVLWSQLILPCRYLLLPLRNK